MTSRREVSTLFFLLLLPAFVSCKKHTPTGVHLSLGTNEDEMVVTWATHKATSFSSVEYGKAEESSSSSGDDFLLPLRTNGTQREFIDDGPAKSVRFMHTVVLRDLEPGVKYEYRVGGHSPEPKHWSATFFFFAKRSPAQISSGPPLKMIAVCDVGVQESAGLLKLIEDELQKDANSSSSSSSYIPDVLIQCGDFAYDLDTDNGKNGDEFMEHIQPVAAYVPYMVSAGNHENAYNFSHYAERFTMPGHGGITGNQYYSFDVGPVHVVAYNGEAFFWPEHFDVDYISRMYRWLEDDLRRANENRVAVPWIVVHAHRPMYCVETESAKLKKKEKASLASAILKLPKKLRLFGEDILGVKSPETPGHCEWEREAARKGVPSSCLAEHGLMCSKRAPEGQLGGEDVDEEAVATAATETATATATAPKTKTETKMKRFPVEDLFFQYGVDVAFFGHEHAYERFYPVYDEEVKSGPDVTFDRYYNPGATVHVTTGSGGNKNMDEEGKKPNRGECNASSPWCAYESGYDRHDGHSSDFTYGRITVHNSTTLEWEQISAVTHGRVIDRFLIVAPTHGPFGAPRTGAENVLGGGGGGAGGGSAVPVGGSSGGGGGTGRKTDEDAVGRLGGVGTGRGYSNT